jgi:GntR family galactonate operon transcriptional repressor
MGSSFPSLQRQTLVEQVAREIGLRIMRNDFKPGDALLKEPELSLQFNVSRPVLREALKMLDAKGLIESRPKIGTRVRQRIHWNLFDPDVIAWQNEAGPDLQFLLAVCEVRLMFEPMTAGLTATRATPEELALIEQSCQAMQDAVDSMADYIVADLQFHTTICLAAHNEFLSRIITILDAPLRSSRLITSRLPGANQNAMPLHCAVANAIKHRDAGAAEEAMRKLVLQTTEDVKRAFET